MQQIDDDARPELENMTPTQLETLLTSSTAFKEFAASYLQGSSAARALEDIRQRNQSLAKENTSLQRGIEEARTHVAIVKSAEYSSAKATFDALLQRQEAVLAKLSPTVLLTGMRKEADKLDEESDAVLEQYQAGSLPLEQLVEQYLGKRCAHHLVDIKRQAAEATLVQTPQ